MSPLDCKEKGSQSLDYNVLAMKISGTIQGSVICRVYYRPTNPLKINNPSYRNM